MSLSLTAREDILIQPGNKHRLLRLISYLEYLCWLEMDLLHPRWMRIWAQWLANGVCVTLPRQEDEQQLTVHQLGPRDLLCG